MKHYTKRNSFFYSILAFLIFIPSLQAQLTVTTNPTIANIINTIEGEGVTISNVTISCASNGYGLFDLAGTTPMGLTQGVLLTSGTATGAIGPNNVGNLSGNMGTGGNALLTTLAGATTQDACILEFDVVPAGDRIEFRYSFGSEEYPEWVNSSYNDVFAFMISGPGIAGEQNIALIPATTTPVTINNVNVGSNATYYQTNATGNATFQYDGYTVNLVATRTGLTPCATYRVR
ncbi:choice-of-anchor L domain-containing protein [Hugenholtzia roseola]|uniref:choice-of-anchor L domain-containing protein n=1 Tax=Hugenholtzia roseola TaxID=1002 RepID=UPI000686F80A|nr:choice-of-anchor L domain-containing protein [Hugenholtzia roseola]